MMETHSINPKKNQPGQDKNLSVHDVFQAQALLVAMNLHLVAWMVDGAMVMALIVVLQMLGG